MHPEMPLKGEPPKVSYGSSRGLSSKNANGMLFYFFSSLSKQFYIYANL